MADIKTKDSVKGTIKTIDKAAALGQRMKQAYVQAKEKAEHLLTLRKIVRRNMPLTVLRAVLTVLLTKQFINSISRDEMAFLGDESNQFPNGK